MRVLHVATLLTPDAAHDESAQGAIDMAAELAARGHDVTLAGAVREHDDVVDVSDGVHCWCEPAVHHTGGVIDRTLDVMRTRPVLRDADRVLYLTADERDRLTDVAGQPLRMSQLGTGLPASRPRRRVADDAGIPEVLFVAPMHLQQRPDVFVRAARVLLSSGVRARFSVVGPPAGAEREVEELVDAAQSPYIRFECAASIEDLQERFSASYAYVRPATGESYPRQVIAAMAAGCPVVVADSCGLADTVDEYSAGIVVDDTDESLVRALRALLDEPQAASEMGRRGQRAVEREFSIHGVVDDLVGVYRECIGGHPLRSAIAG